MLNEAQPQPESPIKFHRDIIHSLRHEWQAMPDKIITDDHYEEGNEATRAIAKNKYRMAWFNAISQEIPLIVEDNLISEIEAPDIRRRSRQVFWRRNTGNSR